MVIRKITCCQTIYIAASQQPVNQFFLDAEQRQTSIQLFLVARPFVIVSNQRAKRNIIIKRFSDQILKSKQYVFNTSLSYIFICPIGSRRKEQETWLCIYKTVFWSNFGWQSSLLWKTNIQSNSPTLKVPFPGNEKVENIKVDRVINALEQKPTKTTRLKLTGKGRREHTEIVKEDH